MPEHNSDSKTSIKVNLNTIKIEFPADLDLIALAYFGPGDPVSNPGWFAVSNSN